MPTLRVFTLGFFASLLVFHLQADLPWFAIHLHREFGSAAVLASLALCCSLCFFRQGSICASWPAVLVWLAVGGLSAQISVGLQAVTHRNMQVPLACNKVVIQSEFLLIEKVHRTAGQQSWLIEHMPPTSGSDLGCLKSKARLQLFVEDSDRFSELLPGHRFRASIRLKPPRTLLQMQGFDAHQHWFARKIAGTAQLQDEPRIQQPDTQISLMQSIARYRLSISEWILAALQGHEELPLILAMVVGDQGLISPEDRDMYSATGIAHLVAISGLHITMLAMLAGKVSGMAWRRSSRLCLLVPGPVASAGFGLVFATLYALIAGWGVPAQRTVFMLLALFAGTVRGGLQNGWDSFFLALFLALLLDHWAVLDAGFILSFGAVAILIAVTQGHFSFIKPRFEFLANAVRAQYAVTIGLILPTAILFNQQSLISPAVNALSIPWMSFISTPLALTGGLFRQAWAVQLAADSLSIQRQWLLAFNSVEWATLPVHAQPLWVYLIAAVACLLLLLPAGLVHRGWGLLLLMVLAWPAPRPEQGAFWITLMDVGQGTAVAVQTHRHLLIYDAGPAFNPQADTSRRILLPWMGRHGYAHPDQFMLSHDDADHAGGAPLLLRTTAPRQFASSVSIHHHLSQQARLKGSQYQHCHTMPAWTWDGVLFQPIAPSTTGTGIPKPWAKNNQSCVLRISNNKHSLLLAGDIEAIAEMNLLVSHGAAGLKSRILLAPHHGSKTSSTLPFLQAVQPEFVFVQSGWQNQFKHPHPEVTRRYEAMNMAWFNTAQDGAIQLKLAADHADVDFSSALKTRQRYWHLHEKSAQR